MSHMIKFNWIHFLVGDDSITLAEAIHEKATAVGVRYPLLELALWDVLTDVEFNTGSGLVMRNSRAGAILSETDYPLTADVQWWICHRDDIWQTACSKAVKYAKNERR